MKIYTRTGDDGFTSLPGGRRVSKYSLRIEVLGSIDELNSWIGLLRGYKEIADRKDTLVYIQKQLMNCAAIIARGNGNEDSGILLPDDDCIEVIEKEIDSIQGTLPEMNKFVLPGGNIVVSYCHIARCVCRRAERSIFRLSDKEKTPAFISKFLNRLSDYLFILSKKISFEIDNEDITWG
jgi:cob(I)alamin adenosyltransferase